MPSVGRIVETGVGLWITCGQRKEDESEEEGSEQKWWWEVRKVVTWTSGSETLIGDKYLESQTGGAHLVVQYTIWDNYQSMLSM